MRCADWVAASPQNPAYPWCARRHINLDRHGRLCRACRGLAAPRAGPPPSTALASAQGAPPAPAVPCRHRVDTGIPCGDGCRSTWVECGHPDCPANIVSPHPCADTGRHKPARRARDCSDRPRIPVLACKFYEAADPAPAGFT